MFRPQRLPVLITFIRVLFANNYSTFNLYNLYNMEKKKRQLSLNFTSMASKKGKIETELSEWAKLEPLSM